MNIFGPVLAVGQVSLIDPRVLAGTAPQWRAVVHDVAGVSFTAAAVVVVAVLIIGVIVAVVGRRADNGVIQSTGFMVMVWVLVSAAALGSVSGLVSWSSAPDLVPAVDPGVSAAAGTVFGLGA